MQNKTRSALPSTPHIIPAEGALTAFTDGACLPRPRRGGIGVRFVHSDALGHETIFELDESGYAGATNNQMELQALVTALRAINERRIPAHLLEDINKVDLYTDSLYVIDNLNSAIFTWPNTAWMTHAGPPVLNADLWKELVREYKKLKRTIRAEIKWGKGHSSDNPHNKAADKLAKQSARRPTRALRAVSVRRKKSTKALQHGSVGMLGQRLTIRIVAAEYLPTQKLHRYKYEVMSRRSSFYGNLDVACSNDTTLRPGHTYYVTMNDDPSFPRIAKCHREVVHNELPPAARQETTVQKSRRG